MDDKRILELLELISEYLKKTDQAIGRIDLAYDVLLKHSDQLLTHAEELRELRKESLKRETQQEAILKEIFSISKRVQSVEEKK